MQTSCNYFFSILTFYIVVSSFCFLDIYLSSTWGTTKQSVGALNVGRVKLLSPWELFVQSIGLGCSPAHHLRGFGPHWRLPILIWLNTRGITAMSAVAAPLVLLSHLTVGWMKARLLGKRPLSFPLRINLQGDFIHSLPHFINYFSNKVD